MGRIPIKQQKRSSEFKAQNSYCVLFEPFKIQQNIACFAEQAPLKAHLCAAQNTHTDPFISILHSFRAYFGPSPGGLWMRTQTHQTEQYH